VSDKQESEQFDQEPALEIDEAVLEEARQEKELVNPVPHRRRSGAAGFFSLLALLLAGGGIAAGYYLYEKEIKPLKRLPTTVTRLEQSSASKQQFTELQNQLQSVSAGNEAIRSELANSGGDFQSLQAGLAELRETAGWGKHEWSLAEVNYLLTVAKQQLQLLQDPATAAAALQGAIRRLDTLHDPALGELRNQIVLDLQSVENYQALNSDEILAGLVAASSGLQPLPEPDISVERSESETSKPLSDKGLRDIWDSFRSSLTGRVRVVKHEAPLNALTQAGVEAYKIDNLNLRIEILRLTLMRNDMGAFKRELASLAAWVEQAIPVKQAEALLTEIGNLRSLQLPPLPQLHANVSGSSQATEPAPGASQVEAATETMIVPVEVAPAEVEPEPVEPVAEEEMQQIPDTESVPESFNESVDFAPAEEEAAVTADESLAGQTTEAVTDEPEAAGENAQPDSDLLPEIQELDKLLQQLDFEQQEGAAQ